MVGIVGTKIGMTRIYDAQGHVVPVTIIKPQAAKVLEVMSREKQGYDAIKIGYGRRSKKSSNRAIQGYLKKVGGDPSFKLKEFRTKEKEGESFKLGQSFDVSLFDAVEYVDVTGVSKGKGYQGVMKRHGFAGGPGGHGSHFHRAPGSIGNCSYPARVFKGKKMAGQMGGVKKTVQNLPLVKVDKEKGVLLVKGAIPGKNSGEVIVRQSIKKANQKASTAA